MNAFRLFNVLLFVCLLATSGWANNSDLVSTSFQFMSHKISVQYDPGMVFKDDICLKKKCFKRFYQRMAKAPYQVLMQCLEQTRESLQLPDWFFYQMVNKAAAEVIGKKDRLHQGLITWFLFNKMGYDARLAVTKGGDPFIYAFTLEEMSNAAPSFKDGAKHFINLTSIDLQYDTRRIDLYKADFIANEKGKGFQFRLTEAPKMEAEPVEKTIAFDWHDQEFNWMVKADRAYAELLKTYPKLSDVGYATTTISTTLKESLYPQLQTLIEGKTTREALEILVSFTRRSFTLKSDWAVHDDDHPMYAEQLFFSEYSDHEDRCALLYNLIKDLLDLPMVILTHYNNDMTIGVEWAEEADRLFEHKGKQYLICDPTVPARSSKVGAFPNGMTPMTTRVLATFE
ncbi:MAG: hypothetical protein AAF985_11770 [Bacteroidota bacterium]